MSVDTIKVTSLDAPTAEANCVPGNRDAAASSKRQANTTTNKPFKAPKTPPRTRLTERITGSSNSLQTALATSWSTKSQTKKTTAKLSTRSTATAIGFATLSQISAVNLY